MRTRNAGRWATAAVFGLVALGCAQPGAGDAVRFADACCVIGTVRPDRLMIEVTGTGTEFGCLEPYTQ
jgi:hypothetical protein